MAFFPQMLNYADTVPEVMEELNNGITYFSNRIETHFNLSKDFRKENLGDDPDNFSIKFYGNNDVDGPDLKRRCRTRNPTWLELLLQLE